MSRIHPLPASPRHNHLWPGPMSANNNSDMSEVLLLSPLYKWDILELGGWVIFSHLGCSWDRVVSIYTPDPNLHLELHITLLTKKTCIFSLFLPPSLPPSLPCYGLSIKWHMLLLEQPLKHFLIHMYVQCCLLQERVHVSWDLTACWNMCFEHQKLHPHCDCAYQDRHSSCSEQVSYLENSTTMVTTKQQLGNWGYFPKYVALTITFLRKTSTTYISVLLPKALTCSDTFPVSNEVHLSVLGHLHSPYPSTQDLSSLVLHLIWVGKQTGFESWLCSPAAFWPRASCFTLWNKQNQNKLIETETKVMVTRREG